jgi:murein DD-endopeptidase MepM/ murein hydrolase activator NlpD
MARILAAAMLALAVPAAAEPVELEGTWYVLVHFKDDNAPNPEQDRWDDKVWSFEKKGRRLKWTEYPIVVFDDEAGRFERRNTGQYARILHYWEPNAAQRSDIRDGLQVNSRGSKQKSLRGSDAKGWSSARQTSAASASVVTYQEIWSIEGMPSLPVFERADYMGGGRSDSLEGLTQYATTKVEGDVISGSFERDGTRHGTFRMMRAGEVGALKGAKTQSELQQKATRRAIAANPEARKEAAALIEEALVEAGLGLPEDEIQSLAGEAVDLYLQRVPQSQIRERLTERVRQKLTHFATTGASHDDSVLYRWPFESPRPRRVLGAVRGDVGAVSGTRFDGFRKPESLENAFNFELPVGTPVVAAREGRVVRVIDGHTEGGPQQGMALKSNTVVVLHEDGSFAFYTHLSPGIEVELSQRVEVGDRLGKSGATGQVFEPELFFGVQVLESEGRIRSVEIRFDDGTQLGVLPVVGAYYGGE